MIQAYFNRIKTLVDTYTATSLVLDASVSFEMRPGGQGYLRGLIIFVDDSKLHFREFLDTAKGTIDKLMYVYHYQDAGDLLIFRYDNAPHRPALRSLEHKHTPEQIMEILAPTLDDVLAEIAIARGWV